MVIIKIIYIYNFCTVIVTLQLGIAVCIALCLMVIWVCLIKQAIKFAYSALDDANGTFRTNTSYTSQHSSIRFHDNLSTYQSGFIYVILLRYWLLLTSVLVSCFSLLTFMSVQVLSVNVASFSAAPCSCLAMLLTLYDSNRTSITSCRYQYVTTLLLLVCYYINYVTVSVTNYRPTSNI